MSDGDAPDLTELELVALAAIIRHAEEGDGRELLADYAHSGVLVLVHEDGRDLAHVAIIATPTEGNSE